MSVIIINKFAVKKAKRIGRGIGSGRGGPSGRGSKGQNARTGGGVRPGFEGGQMPLYRRVPKRGFKNINRVEFNIVNISSLSVYEEGSEVSIESLKEKGIIKNNLNPVKMLANGELNVKKLTISVNACSAVAKEKIESLGGKINII